MAKLAKLVVDFSQEPVRVLAYNRAARGRSALNARVYVHSDKIRTFLSDSDVSRMLNVQHDRTR